MSTCIEKIKSISVIFLMLGIAGFAAAQSAPPQEKTFQVSRGGNLEVSVRSGDIHLNAWEKESVSVIAEGIDQDELRNLEISQQGNTIVVRFRPEWDGRHVRFRIQVPAEFQSNLKTSGGDIKLSGTFGGKVSGSTSGGDIEMNDVNGNVDLSTSGGDIDAGNILGDVRLHTSGGDIKVGDCTGTADLHTSGGDIHVGNVGKKLTARTAGGDVVIGDVGGEADISTAGGDVEVGKVTGSASLRTAGGDIELRGGNGTIRAKTAGGDVDLRNISGSVEASTSGGDVHAELRPSGTGRSFLSSSGGDLTLILPENAKATIDALIDINGRWRDQTKECDIISDFKSQNYQKDPDSKEIRAKFVLNGGGEVISLETTNGSIYIRKSVD